MTPQQTALARARTYGMLAELFLDGWTDRVLGVIDGLEWARSIPADPDQRAARHHRVLGRGVPPYESVFLAEDALLGGAVATAVREDYAQMGFGADRPDVEPDHVGLQCAALAFLCGAEAHALEDGVPTERFVLAQRNFLRAHLGRWVASLAIAVEGQGVAELTEAVGLLRDLVEDHGGPFGAEPEASEPLLDDPKTGLKTVARYLLVPARCGVWFGLDDIQRIAARAELACGFGRRVQMMESLWFSAVDHGRVPQLVESLGVELDRWPPSPRVTGTRGMLARLGEAVDSA